MNWRKSVLIVVAAGQLAIPAYLIHRQETTLREGRAYKFKTAPVDPYDAFRGRYVALRYEQDHAPWPGTNQVLRQQRAYARVEEGVDGFALVREVTPRPPVTGDFFKVQANYAGWGTNAGTVYFTMPFDRYYMEETKAPKAEQVYRANNRRGQTNQNTYAVVRIRQGHAALENLFVAGQPITEMLREKQP
ncbi:MAG: GDYXXLXY domain-containing protein [Verrucomicrobiota bacterium]